MPRLSIIIPVLGNPAQMEDTLVSVLENRPPECEILAILNRRYEDPYDLKDEVRFVEVARESRLIDMVNTGIGLSRAAIVQLLPCGVQASEGWADAALAHFNDPQMGAVAPIVVDRHNPQRVVAAGAIYRSTSGKLRRLADRVSLAQTRALAGVVADPECQVCFYRRAALEQVGQFSHRVGSRLASVDVAMALTEAGFRTLLEPGCRMLGLGKRRTSESAFAYGQRIERLFWRWLPQKLRLVGLVMHAVHVSGELAKGFYRPSTIARFAGRIAGCRQMRQAENYLRGAEKPAPSPKPPSSGGSHPHLRTRPATANRQSAAGDPV